jgi:hypothetical protein
MKLYCVACVCKRPLKSNEMLCEKHLEATSDAEEEKMENRQATADNAKQGHINKCIKKTSM